MPACVQSPVSLMASGTFLFNLLIQLQGGDPFGKDLLVFVTMLTNGSALQSYSEKEYMLEN